MNARSAWMLSLTVLGAVAAGWALATLSEGLLEARAEEPVQVMIDGTEPVPVSSTPFSLRCRTFEIPLGETMELPGDDSEAGRWVQEQTGYTIWTVDYEAVQKATGYPQHMLQVCVTPG